MRARVVARLLLAASVVMVWLAPAAFSQTTTEQRVTALEAKTNFYTQSVNRVALNYRKGDATGICNSNQLSLDMTPAVSMVGTSYTWLTATLKYRGVKGTDRLFTLIWVATQGMAPCAVSADPLSTETGTITLKGYCPFGLRPGEKIRVTIDLMNSEEAIDVCQVLATAKLKLKLVNIGIHEPAD